MKRTTATVLYTGAVGFIVTFGFLTIGVGDVRALILGMAASVATRLHEELRR